MKSFLIFCMGLLSLVYSYGQVPAAFSYQAVSRNVDGTCMSNDSISIRINIRDSLAAGPIVYSERHDNILTNDQGLFSLEIGNGIQQGGTTFESIPWDYGSKWLEVEMDPEAGANFTLVGSQKLMSVPYAIIAGRAHIPYDYDFSIVPTSSADRNQWLSDADVEVTAPESGTYLIIATGRVLDLVYAQGEWSKFRVYNETAGSILGEAFISWNEDATGARIGDKTAAISIVSALTEGDILRLDFWINSSQNPSPTNAIYGGDDNGRSTLSILKLGS